jgi:hypothetical protein
MSTLFCTPEQGARLKELVPELESGFVWVIRIGSLDHIPYLKESNQDLWKFPKEFTPALTLQELRDVAWHRVLINPKYEVVADFKQVLIKMTAPELAEWVIARLEEAK